MCQLKFIINAILYVETGGFLNSSLFILHGRVAHHVIHMNGPLGSL